MLNVLKAAALIAAKKDPRYYLNGVHIFRDDKGEIWLEASDGHVAMKAQLEEENIIQNVRTPFDVIIPIADVQLVVKHLKFVVLNIDDLCFSESIRFKSIDGRYPDLQRVLNQNKMSRNKPADEFGLSAELVINVMKAVSFVADKGSKDARWPAIWNVKSNTEPVLIKAGGVEFVIMPVRI